MANHPKTLHFTEDIRTLDITPIKVHLEKQKKFIGNAVEVNMSRVMCEALSSKINSTN